MNSVYYCSNEGNAIQHLVSLSKSHVFPGNLLSVDWSCLPWSFWNDGFFSYFL